MKLNWYLVNCGVKVFVHDDLIVLRSLHKLISSSWCLWPEKSLKIQKKSTFIARFLTWLCALATDKHCIHSCALELSLAFKTKVRSSVKISKALGILRRPSLATFTDLMEPTSRVWVKAEWVVPRSLLEGP